MRRLVLKIVGLTVTKTSLDAMSVKSIVVLRIDRIGDLVVSLPALRALKRIFPNAKISVLIKEESRALLNIYPWIDEAISYKGLIGTVKLLRKRRFDLAIDLLMDYTVKTAFITYLSNSKFTSGFDIAGRGACFNMSIKPGQRGNHISCYMLDLVHSLAKSYAGKDYTDDTMIDFMIPKRNMDNVQSLLQREGIGKEDIIVIMHPGGHYNSQRWPVDRFAALADIIIEEFGAKIIAIGSALDAQIIDKLSGAIKEKPVKMMGLALDDLAALISMADLFIGNNSGPWHIACAVNIPTVSTMGPTDPSLWGQTNERHIVIRRNIPCSPCDKAACDRHECMKMISVEDMMEAVRAQIKMSKKIRNERCA